VAEPPPTPNRRRGESVIQVKVKKGEIVERALKRLKKILDKEGMMKQLRANRYFEKPSEKKRKKSARARSRSMSRE
jgi:small subunit ribosomal protein S21